MSPLPNQRHEAFCRLIAKGEAGSKSYAAIYHVGAKCADASAPRLLANVRVASRIRELKNGAAKKTEKTLSSMIENLDVAIEFARQCGNASAMIAGYALQCKILGFEAPKQLEIMHRPAPLPTRVLELSVEEWEAQFASGTGSRPALTDGAKRLKAEKRKMNGQHAHGESLPSGMEVPNPINWGGDPVEPIMPNCGVIDLD